MRIYEYKCSVCEIVFEVSKEIEGVLEYEKCPQCGNNCVQKLSSPPIIFTGSGFHKTDYVG